MSVRVDFIASVIGCLCAFSCILFPLAISANVFGIVITTAGALIVMFHLTSLIVLSFIYCDPGFVQFLAVRVLVCILIPMGAVYVILLVLEGNKQDLLHKL
jgi:hypothetical protein